MGGLVYFFSTKAFLISAIITVKIIYSGFCPQSPTARVHVAAGGNIIGKSFLMMAKCRGDGGEPSQRAARAGVVTLWC